MSSPRPTAIADLVTMLRSGDVSAGELMASTLRAIDVLNPAVNAFTALWADDSLEHAQAHDAATVRRGELWGMPSADKDLVNRAGRATRWGSRATKTWPVATESDPMATWLDSTGAISVGKTATSEFGLTGYTETAAFGPTRNPHDLTRGTGGSSGGAAAAVASGMLAFAPGSDGGGSIRIPALACGVVGLKPSRGRVPAQSGMESLSQLVVPGIIARSVADVSFVSDALFRGHYPWATGAPPLGTSLTEAHRAPVTPLRVAVTTVTPWAQDVDCPLDPEAQRAVDVAVAALTDAGHLVDVWDWAPLSGFAQAFSVMWQASTTGMAMSAGERERVEPLTRFLIDRGRDISAENLVATVAWLRQFERDTIAQMAGWDAVITPGLATLPPEVGFYDDDDGEKNFLQQIRVTPYTSFVNVCGLPALALPTHYTPGGLPMGVQVVGPPGREDTVVALGHHIEQRVGAMRWPAHSVAAG